MRWHQIKIEDVFEQLQSSSEGISLESAQKRLDEYGANELKEKAKKSRLILFLGQFKDFMILVLIAAAVVSGIIGEPSDAIAIIAIVVINAVIGFIQEYRAEKALTALKEMAAPFASVIRNGIMTDVPASKLVPGDVTALEAGKLVPADIRLTEAVQLKIGEAALTGESAPAEKHTKELRDEMLPIGDRGNMAYMGTMVSYGKGKGIVVSTGMDTELGKIAAMLRLEEVKTPLQKRLAGFGQRLAIAILAICAIIFAAGILRGEEPALMFLTAVSLAVAAIPEALPAVITISLAIGAKKMVEQNALIRKLPAVETLGSVTYICSDKTGTLTMNKMKVDEIYVDGRIIKGSRGQGVEGAGEKINHLLEPLNPRTLESLLFTALALSNDARLDAAGNIIGDPTETALLSAAGDYGFNKTELEKYFPRVAEIPFDPDRKCMTTFHKIHDAGYRIHPPLSPLIKGGIKGGYRASCIMYQASSFVSFTKGAIEVLMEKADGILTSAGTKDIDRDEIHRANDRMAADGLRVIGIAMRKWDALPHDMLPGTVETGLTILGLAGLIDPPREKVREAVSLCKTAGIKPVMITGDHPVTARAIAKRIGMLEDDGIVITGRELEKLSLEEFENRVEHIRVYARVAPEQKLKIVQALQDKGQFVAMTGDGVNDAPALKRADIGIAMGITGTDVAKESAHMILLDDNFVTIVNAVNQGRKIYDNIRKFVKYLLSTNSGEIWTLFLAPLLGLPIPLVPIQILWINLMTDGLPALALSAEPAEQDVMKRPPRDPGEGIFAHGLGVFTIWVGLLMAGLALSIQAWAVAAQNPRWQTMVFTVLCLTQLGNVLAVRSEKDSLFKIGLFSNKSLLGAVLLSLCLQMMTVYAPALNQVFKTQPLTPGELMLTLAASSVVFFAVEGEKFFRRKRWRRFLSRPI